MVDHSQEDPDISWLAFFVYFLAVWVAAYVLGEKFDSIGNVHIAERIMWYAGKTIGVFILPGVPIFITHSIRRRSGNGMRKPKLFAVVFAMVFAALAFGCAAIRS